MKRTEKRPSAQVLGVEVDAIDMKQALAHITRLVQGEGKGYVCVAGVHGIMEAQRNQDLFQVYAGSEMTIPDGMPLVWVGHMQGHTSMKRVAGPDLMLEVFQNKRLSSITHFLYGGDDGVAEELRDRLRERFPWVKIVGTYTPPFRDLSDEESEQFIATVRSLKPEIIWVGISCPKQEVFMARYLPLLETKLMFGVGAAFDYHTGRIRDCAEWIKRAGLQWLHRLMQDPKRLWRRYLRNNPAFLFQVTLQLLGMRRPPRKLEVCARDSQRQAEVGS